MNQQLVWQQFTQLPLEAQKEVANFIAYLQTRYIASTTEPTPMDWGQEPIVGMWADREDMEDSSAWVHRLRQDGWGVKSDE